MNAPKEDEMLYLKSCPRCEGDMHINSDIYGEYKECLQCGHMVDIPRPKNLFSLSDAKVTKKKVA